jgi:hypothetical protein
VRIEKVKWDQSGTEQAEECRRSFLNGKGNKNRQQGTEVFARNIIISAAIRVESFNCELSYIVLRYRCCDIVVLNVHPPSETESDDSKDIFWGCRIYVGK